jgi:hypothetical protein
MQLSFNYIFENLNDEVFCAFTVPYSYSTLQSHLKHLKALSSKLSCKLKQNYLSFLFVKLIKLSDLKIWETVWEI